MSVAVVVPTFRRPDALERTLRALAAQTRAPHRIVVVRRPTDSATAGRLALLKRNMQFEEILVDQDGQVAAIRAGVARCTEDVIAHVDDDAAPRPDWLSNLVRHYRPHVGAVGGTDVIHQDAAVDSTPHRDVGRVTWFGRLIGNHHRAVGEPRNVAVLKAVNMSMRRELWQPDENLRGEGAQTHMEVALCLRARRLGWSIVLEPAAIVDHYPAPRFDDDDRARPSLRAKANVEFNYAYSMVRHLPWWRLPAAVLYIVVIGNRAAPGLLIWAHLVGRRRAPVWTSLRLLAKLTYARLEGVREGLRWRLQGGDDCPRRIV